VRFETALEGTVFEDGEFQVV